MNAALKSRGSRSKQPSRVGIVAILSAPRFANSQATAWMACAMFGLCAATALAIGTWLPDHRAQLVALMVYAMGAAIMWAMWLPGLLLVARDGRHLGVPSCVRTNALATIAYAVLTVALPVAVVVTTGGDVAEAILFPGLGVTAGLAFALSPRWIASGLSFLPAIYIGLHNTFHIASPFAPSFQHTLWIVLAVGVIADCVRWNVLLRRASNDFTGWNTTLLMQLRHNAVSGHWMTSNQWSAWRRPAGQKTGVDLRGVARDRPARALEVALGGWYVPQTWVSRLRSLARVVLPALLFIPIMLLMNLGHSARALWHVFGMTAGLWIGLFGGAMLTFGSAELVQNRWRSRSDTALLALLPGLGSGAQASRHLAHAIFTKPALGMASVTACLLAPMPFLHLGSAAAVMGIAMEVDFAAIGAFAILRTLLGRPLGTVSKLGFGLLLVVLADTSGTLAFVAPTAKWVAASRFEWWLVAAWLALGVWVTLRIRVAWHAVQRRPHPFLPNTPA